MTGTYIFYGVLFAMMLAIWYICHDLMQTRLRNDALMAEIAGMNSTNPWASQLMLMVKSGQHVPTFPAMTKGSLLYGALVIEEAAETLLGLAKGAKEVAKEPDSEMQKLFVDFAHLSKVMTAASLSLRQRIGAMPATPDVLLSKDVAMEILDGITDLHVVTAGLGIACGLPGQAGYDRVATSNLSKANPVTGVIDKDASGKWIKGANYRTPYLGELLAPYYKTSGA